MSIVYEDIGEIKVDNDSELQAIFGREHCTFIVDGSHRPSSATVGSPFFTSPQIFFQYPIASTCSYTAETRSRGSQVLTQTGLARWMHPILKKLKG